MKQRIITATFLTAGIVVMMIFSDTVLLPVVMGLLSLVGTFEFLRCIGLHKKYVLSVPAFVIAFALPFCARYAEEMLTYFAFSAGICFVYMLYCFAVAVFSHRGTASTSDGDMHTLSKDGFRFGDVAAAFTGVFYITVAFSVAVMIRNLHTAGFYLFISLFAVSWLTDTMAYFSGMLFGRHKLIPEVSPKKTVEGAIGGTLGGVIGGILVAVAITLFTDMAPNYFMFALMALVGSVASQIGDLIASLIKREYGIKDYGNLFPGHGGVLDRFDSIIGITAVIFLFSALEGTFALVSVSV